MPETPQTTQQARPVRSLLAVGGAFIVGLVCTRVLRFTHPLPNEIFGAAVLALPFLALRPLSQLPKIPKIIGRIVLTPVLLLSLVVALGFVACGDLQVHAGQDACLEQVASVHQGAYSVHALRDGCGGAMVGFMLVVEQRMPLLPGLYVIRAVDLFDGAYEGKLTVVGPNMVRIQIPAGDPGSRWDKDIDRVYHLKSHVYF